MALLSVHWHPKMALPVWCLLSVAAQEMSKSVTVIASNSGLVVQRVLIKSYKDSRGSWWQTYPLADGFCYTSGAALRLPVSLTDVARRFLGDWFSVPFHVVETWAACIDGEARRCGAGARNSMPFWRFHGNWIMKLECGVARVVERIDVWSTTAGGAAGGIFISRLTERCCLGAVIWKGCWLDSWIDSFVKLDNAAERKEFRKLRCTKSNSVSDFSVHENMRAWTALHASIQSFWSSISFMQIHIYASFHLLQIYEGRFRPYECNLITKSYLSRWIGLKYWGMLQLTAT